MELLKAIKKTSLTCIRKLLRTACGIGLLLKNFTFAWKFIIYYLGIAINDLVISLVLVECAWDWKLSGTDYPRLLFYSDLHLLGKCCHHSIAASSAFAFIRLGCVVFVFVCILRRYAGCQTSWHRFTPVHFCFCFFFVFQIDRIARALITLQGALACLLRYRAQCGWGYAYSRAVQFSLLHIGISRYTTCKHASYLGWTHFV